MGDKSIKVVYSYKIPHPRYRKIINRKTVVHVHDEANEAKPGDRVRIMETRPISRLKRWRLVSVVERAPALGRKSVAEEIEPVAGVEPDAAQPQDSEATPEPQQEKAPQ